MSDKRKVVVDLNNYCPEGKPAIRYIDLIGNNKRIRIKITKSDVEQVKWLVGDK